MARLALEHGYPIDFVVVDLSFHLGPRILKRSNHYSQPVIVWRSIAPNIFICLFEARQAWAHFNAQRDRQLQALKEQAQASGELQLHAKG